MKLPPSIADRKTPVNGLVLRVALGNIGMDPSAQGNLIGDSPSQASTSENRELYLGHVEPTAMFRRVLRLTRF